MSCRLSFFDYRLPLRVPLRTAHGVWAEREGVWLRREWENGTVAYGEIAPVPGFGGPTLAACEERLRALGATPGEAELAAAEMEGGPLGFALGSLRWDVQETLASGAEYLPVAALLPAGRGALVQVEAKLELGFRTFKWKVGVADARDEQAMLDDLLAELPSGARLRLDANGAWDRRTAERWLSVAAERKAIDYVEQPVPASGEDLLLGLAGDYPVTLALDEAVARRADFERWQDLGWPGVYVLKPALWGAPQDLLQAVRESGADVVISSALETVVGARVALSLAFALGESQRALGMGVWPLFGESGFEGPLAAPFVRREDVRALSLESVAQRMEGAR